MKHTTKMLLIPEDVYKALLSSAKSPQKISAAADPDKDLMAQSQIRMKKIGKNKRINPDERQIELVQEFKRYKKYKDDFDQKPINVHMKNIDELLDEQKNSRAKEEALRDRDLQFNTALISPLVENPANANNDASSSNINKYSASPRRLRKQIKPRKIFSPYEKKRLSKIERDQLFKNSQSAENFETPIAPFKPTIW